MRVRQRPPPLAVLPPAARGGGGGGRAPRPGWPARGDESGPRVARGGPARRLAYGHVPPPDQRCPMRVPHVLPAVLVLAAACGGEKTATTDTTASLNPAP